DKPAGLPVHPTARYHKNTLIKMVEAERPGAFIHLAHRIDRETSGVLLLAKTIECDRALKRQFEERDDVKKRYVALTWGNPLKSERISLQSKDPFRRVERLDLDRASRYKVKMRVAKE